ncbi:HD domain-containing protein [Micromonospora zamorensis]|uniref:HD domain-containing protein n=1 Tax=Micromonospora zamorensis TaxID=709883 RepID=UPI00081F7EA8|nr:HD domain-containing protein [Micromonospora zamorensis]SCG44174.1 hypothetical protein GA0070619_1518 [Micromonospora zamorensis]
MVRDPLNAHQGRLEAWTKELLDPYIARLKRHSPPYETAKEFNDPVWGTLQLRPYEVVILDSPLLQRLRRIRQLGVVHFVYPAATHTRLEHSLGVVHQVQRLVTSINDHGLSSDPEGRRDKPLSEHHEIILRLAALCHDVGHGAMSHVSEYSIEEIRECEDIRLQFQKYHERAAPSQLSEIAAYYILGSPAFANLLSEVSRLCSVPFIDSLPEKLQAIVIGKSIGTDVLLLHELISGPFDADKLDYLARDALMCGVPSVADVPRLIQKARAVRVDRTQLPKKLKKLAVDKQGTYLVTGIARSGARTLEEIALARALMFDKIYRHQKVRATEAMVFSLIRELNKITPDHPAMLPFKITDDELLSLTLEDIESLSGRQSKSLSEEQLSAAKAATYIAKRLRDRRLFVRGFAFAAVMPQDPYRDEPEHKEGLERLIADCDKPDMRTRIIAGISKLIQEICPLIDNPTLADVPGGQLDPFIWLSAPKSPPKISGTETGHAYLIDENGWLLQAEENVAETPGWAGAHVSTQDLGYIFSLRRLSTVVFIAAEAYAREEYGIRIPDTMFAYAKQDPTKVDKLKRQLDRAGWYDSKPLDIRPMPLNLTLLDASDRADDIVERLAGYSGPWQMPQAGLKAPTSTINRQKVLSFVRQFHEDDLVDTALTMLGQIKVIGRVDANQALKAFLDQAPDFRSASYTALGEYRDSSALLTYYVGDVAQSNGLTQHSLGEALMLDQPIIFVDDLVGRGSQSISIVEKWLGEKPTEQLNERRAHSLSPSQVAELRRHRLAFVFVAGLDAGRARLEKRLEELGLQADVFVHIPESKLPFLETVIDDTEKLERMKAFCSRKGYELLAAEEHRTEDWMTGRVLGYGNLGLLVASTYNTPSATLTCLWHGGRSAVDWTPLLPRRKKH